MSVSPPPGAGNALRACLSVIVLIPGLMACTNRLDNPELISTLTNIPKTVEIQQPTQAASISLPSVVVDGGVGELLEVHAGQVRVAAPPSRYSMFWDYNGSGTLAFASSPFQSTDSGKFSVSDFWVYDYHKDQSTLWLASNVGRVLWAPDTHFSNRRAAIALFDPHIGDFSLVVSTKPGEAEVVAEYASYAFSWGPEGRYLVYVRRAPPAGLYLVSVDGGHGRKVSDFAYRDGGWLFDEPLWVPGHEVLIVAEKGDHPIRVVSVDGNDEFNPATSYGGMVLGPRPDVMLWSNEGNQLILSGESGFAVETWVHQFSEDLRIVMSSHLIAEATLKGWYQSGESVLVLGRTGIEVHELAGY